MSGNLPIVVGSLAAIASTTSFAPQAWKIIQTRDTKSISVGMYLFTVSGFALWVGYGALLGQWPLIIPNALCFVLAAFILTMKILPQRKVDKVANVMGAKRESK